MRLLANENVPAAAIALLREAGHNVAWIRMDAPGSTDAEVMARSAAEARVLLTLDKDFGELAFRRGALAPPGIILVRISPDTPEALGQALVAALGSRRDWAGHFSVLQSGRVRMTPLPRRPLG